VAAVGRQLFWYRQCGFTWKELEEIFALHRTNLHRYLKAFQADAGRNAAPPLGFISLRIRSCNNNPP